MARRFSESEKLGKLFFQILNFLDSKAWIAEDLRVTSPMVFFPLIFQNTLADKGVEGFLTAPFAC